MLDRLKAALRAVAVYLQDNPGTATLVGGWAVLVLAKLGLHVTQAELYAIASILLPLIAAHHLTARHARARRADVNVYRQAQAEQAQRVNGA